MRIEYSYKVNEDCIAVTEISKSRERNKVFLSLTWGWMFIFAVVAFVFLLFTKADISSRLTGIVISLSIMVIAGVGYWYLFTRYDGVTDRKINNAITAYISSNKRFIESDKKIDSLNIATEAVYKQCMGCGASGRTHRCVVRKKGHAIALPLCERCISKLQAKIK